MKNIKLNIIGILISILFFSVSCNDDFLEQDPQTSLSSEQLFASLENVQPFLDGLYFKWRDTRVNRKGFFLMLGMDESQQGEYQAKTDAEQGGFDKYDGFMEPNNKPVTELWNIRWPVVIQASEALNYLNNMEANTSEDSVLLSSYIGQASFYRAAVLLELATYWGDLPIPEIEGKDIILTNRKPVDEIYGLIEEDFENAISRLEEEPSNSNVRIPTTWAAKALLGKMYMSAPQETNYKDFSKAKNIFEDIVQNGGFSLASNFTDLWDPIKSASNEMIFTFFFNNVWPDANESQWYTGSRACSSIPTNYIGGYDMILPTEYCRTDVSMGGLWEEGDLRKNESIRYDFINGNIAPSVYAGFGEDQLFPHIKKYEDIRIDGIESFYNSGKNVYYVRYADILLLLAECMNELGQTSEAVTLVNETVRERAWGGELPVDKQWPSSMSTEEFRTNILDERMRELCFEGWRRFDLIRTGKFVSLISERNKWAKENGTISEFHKLLPIPLIEIRQNPNLTEADQTLGY